MARASAGRVVRHSRELKNAIAPRLRERAFFTARAVRCALLAMTMPALAAAQEPTGVLIGRITAASGAVPLAMSPVSVDAAHQDRITDDSGRFRFDSLPVGRALRIVVRHIGYAPHASIVTLRAGAPDSLNVALEPIPTKLASVNVRERRECTSPGPPRADVDSTLAALFARLQAYAATYREVSAANPLEWFANQTATERTASGIEFRVAAETRTFQVPDRWRYRPGVLWPTGRDTNWVHPGIVVSETDLRGARIYGFVQNIPLLRQLTDSPFVWNHCYSYAGIETIDGEALFRINFVTSRRVSGPDVDGSLFLDTASARLVHTEMHLTSFPVKARSVVSVDITTDFIEVMPSLAIPKFISVVERFSKPSVEMSPAATFQLWRLVDFKFRKPPGH